MKLAPWFVAALAPFAVIGFGSSYFGHMAVVMLTFGIFFGTLSLGKAHGVQSGANGTGEPT
jgi:hypothetical protein